MTMSRRFTALLLSVCVVPIVAGAAEAQRTYDCGENFRFSVQVEKERAVLAMPEGPVTLQADRAASGARYVAGGYVFWEKADDVMLKTPLESYQGCVRAP